MGFLFTLLRYHTKSYLLVRLDVGTTALFGAMVSDSFGDAASQWQFGGITSKRKPGESMNQSVLCGGVKLLRVKRWNYEI